ncbi:MAG: alpha-amylase family glycosyl hydrolase, partial [Mycoplasma sp.]
GNGNDMYPDHRNQAGGSCVHWGPKAGAAGSPWYTTGWQYQDNPYSGIRPGLEFPAVPYIATDFHCERVLSSWSDPIALNYGWLVGLTDLNTEKDYVRQRISDYITELLSMGVSGIRIDAAKHISPENLSHIFKKLKDNLGGGELPDDFTAYLEILYGGEKELLLCNDSDYSYGRNFEKKMSSAGLSSGDIQKIKLWGSDYPKEYPICGLDAISSERNAVGWDCHDDQNPGSSSRDMGDSGSVYIKEKDAGRHRNFTVQLFTGTSYNFKIKLVWSSYSFMNNGAAGFPDGNSDCSACQGEQCKANCNKSVPYQKAYDPNSKGYDCGSGGGWLEGTYTRVHRDQENVNAMRKWMGLGALNETELYGQERIKAQKMK